MYNPRSLTENGDLIDIDVGLDTIETFETGVNPEYDSAMAGGCGPVAPYATVKDSRHAGPSRFPFPGKGSASADGLP